MVNLNKENIGGFLDKKQNLSGIIIQELVSRLVNMEDFGGFILVVKLK